MKSLTHIIIFSHGFGVRKDDRGLFTDIAFSFSGVESVMFDYNEINEKNNVLIVAPFSKQAKMLSTVVESSIVKSPNAIVDLICHSQGSLVAAIAAPVRIRKTIFIAPTADIGIERTLA